MFKFNFVIAFKHIFFQSIESLNIYFIYLFSGEQKAKLYNHRIYKVCLFNRTIEGREHFIYRPI